MFYIVVSMCGSGGVMLAVGLALLSPWGLKAMTTMLCSVTVWKPSAGERKDAAAPQPSTPKPALPDQTTAAATSQAAQPSAGSPKQNDTAGRTVGIDPEEALHLVLEWRFKAAALVLGLAALILVCMTIIIVNRQAGSTGPAGPPGPAGAPGAAGAPGVSIMTGGELRPAPLVTNLMPNHLPASPKGLTPK